MSENEDAPKLVLKDLGLNQSVTIELETANAVTTGEGKWGTWQLWFGNVEKHNVHIGRGTEEKIKEAYTGKIIFFPSTMLNKDLEKATNGNDNVKVKITKTESTNKFGTKLTKYIVEKLSEGELSSSSLSNNETNLLKEAQSLKNDGFDVTEDIFIKSSQEPHYGNDITESRAKELYKYIK